MPQRHLGPANDPNKVDFCFVIVGDKAMKIKHQFALIEKIILTSNKLSEADKARLKDSLKRWRDDYPRKDKPNLPKLTMGETQVK